jgi:Fe-S-cluster-containing hydrogenase component 2
VVLPVLTKKRTRCADCVSCQRGCPTLALHKQSVAAGATLLTCMRCEACVDVCHKDAARWHIKGTSATPETARLMFLYAAWAFATMFGGTIIANSLEKLVHVFV